VRLGNAPGGDDARPCVRESLRAPLRTTSGRRPGGRAAGAGSRPVGRRAPEPRGRRGLPGEPLGDRPAKYRAVARYPRRSAPAPSGLCRARRCLLRLDPAPRWRVHSRARGGCGGVSDLHGVPRRHPGPASERPAGSISSRATPTSFPMRRSSGAVASSRAVSAAAVSTRSRRHVYSSHVMRARSPERASMSTSSLRRCWGSRRGTEASGIPRGTGRRVCRPPRTRSSPWSASPRDALAMPRSGALRRAILRPMRRRGRLAPSWLRGDFRR
jgi:hypothetical protein